MALGFRRSSRGIGGFPIRTWPLWRQGGGATPQTADKNQRFHIPRGLGGDPYRRSRGSRCEGAPSTQRGHMENPGRIVGATGGKKTKTPPPEPLNRRNSLYGHFVGFGRFRLRGPSGPVC